MSSLKRLLKAAVLLTILGLGMAYFYRSHMNSNEAAEKMRRATLETDEAIKKFVLQDGADSEWFTELVKDNRAFDTVLTAELQEYWLAQRPILFEGKIIDVSRNLDGSYELFVEYTSDNRRPDFFANVFQLKIQCPRSKIDKLLEWRSKNPGNMHGRLAVTASIQSIDSNVAREIHVDSESGSSYNVSPLVQLGRGVCLSLLPIPDEIRN
ncbi:hypothetical protein OU994_29820 [Pseudoduganella sp. SL102]|uniref:hypothetical protein n=1 Tax=Pseudoduganella sp. SL102 TaxID=2995154 RepID=UPI00248C6901|nr:hypothetical protein [Pseudoduganella sp. SL102]WBS02392.1 hypothetical protein OU994_29820 [Pseudoduganella sp. SL102]